MPSKLRVFATCDIGESIALLRDHGHDVEVHPQPEAPPKSLVIAKVRSGIDGLITTLRDQIDAEIFEAEAVAKRAHIPMERVFVNIQRYGNMSAATVPVALCEALEQQLIKPGALLLMPSFGAGLTFCAHLVRWGQRTTPSRQSDVDLSPAPQTALQRVRQLMAAKGGKGVQAS